MKFDDTIIHCGMILPAEALCGTADTLGALNTPRFATSASSKNLDDFRQIYYELLII